MNVQQKSITVMPLLHVPTPMDLSVVDVWLVTSEKATVVLVSLWIGHVIFIFVYPN